jgi:DNA-binding transcriptional LysR family regulator
VLVRLQVEILAAHGAEAGAVGPAEDLLRQLEGNRISCPGAEIETVVDDVVRPPLVPGAGIGIVKLTGNDREVDFCMAQAAHARPREMRREAYAKRHAPRNLRDLDLGRNRMRNRLVALPAEDVRVELDLEGLTPDLAGAKAKPGEIKRSHGRRVTPPVCPEASHALASGLVAFDSIMDADRWLGLDLRHLVALKTIADEGSFGRAADRLGYTQSAVSQQIAALERAVGMRLIERPGGPRPISLTEAGTILLRHAEAIDARLRAAKADMEALRAGEAGRLRIGTFQSVGAKVLPTLLRRFGEAYPGVEISLQESASEDELLELVERGELDVTFNTLPLVPGPFESVELLRDPYVLVVPAGSPLAAVKRPPSLREITLQPLIGFSRCRAIDAVESHLGSSGRTPNIVFRSDNNGTVQGLVAAGVGVSVAPLLTVDADDESVVVIDLGGRIPPRVIGLAWHRDRHQSPAATALVETAIAVCGDLGVESAAA